MLPLIFCQIGRWKKLKLLFPIFPCNNEYGMGLLKDRIKTVWEDDFAGSPQELMKMRLNKLHLYMVLILLITGVLYTSINLLYGLWDEAFVTATAIAFSFLALFMYARKWYLVSKISLVLYVTAVVAILAMISGIDTGILTFMVPVIVGY